MNDSCKILLCEDDENLGMLLREFLDTKGFQCDLFPDGEAGLKAFSKGGYEMCILDIMMPKKDGFELAKDIRSQDPVVPIIFLTAKFLKEDIIEGFRIGADDYMTKPFSMEELLCRINAIQRRVSGKRKLSYSTYNIGRFVFDPKKQQLLIDGKVKKLTTKESELLLLLASRPNEILERNFALKNIWAEENYFNARSMDVYVTKLRKILADDPDVALINIHGKGYKLAYS